MIFDIDATEGEKFFFFSSRIDLNTGEVIYDDPVNDAWVTLKNPAQFYEERVAKRKREVEHVFNPKTRQMERVAFFKEMSIEEARAERDDATDYTIADFGGFKDKSGKVIKVTRENKLKMMKTPVFDRFVGRCITIMNEGRIKEEKEQEKNS